MLEKGIPFFKAPKIAMLLLFLVLCCPTLSQAQTDSLNLKKIIELAVANNLEIKALESQVSKFKALSKSSFDLGKTEIFYNNDQNNIAENGFPIKVWGISQSFQSPSVYVTQHQLANSHSKLAEHQLTLKKRTLAKNVTTAYLNITYWQQLVKHYARLDSLYTRASQLSQKRLTAGESNYLEKITIETKQKEVSLLMEQAKRQKQKAVFDLKKWVQAEFGEIEEGSSMPTLVLQQLDTANHSGVSQMREQLKNAEIKLKLKKNERLPNFNLSLFQGTNNQLNAKKYTGFQVGLALPIWYKPFKHKIAAAHLEKQSNQHYYDNYMLMLSTNYQAILLECANHQASLNYYHTVGKNQADELANQAQKAFNQGDIDFLQYVQLVETAKNIELNFLQNLYHYNLLVNEANYIVE